MSRILALGRVASTGRVAVAGRSAASNRQALSSLGRVFGLSGYSTATRLATASGQGLQGNAASGHWVRLLFWPTSVTGASATRTYFSTNSGSTGHRIRTTSSNTLLQYGAFIGGSEQNTTALTLTAAMLGKLLDVVFVYDQPNALLVAYLDGVAYSSGSASGAYSPAVGTRMTQGSTPTPSSPCSDNVIAGIEGGDGFVPSAAEILAAYNATVVRVKSGLAPLAGIAGKTTWSGQIGPAWNPPVVITDTIGGQNLTMVNGVASSLALQSTLGVWA